MRRWGAIAAGLIAGMALAGPASGSVVEVSASAGPAAEEYLEYRASSGESNRVTVGMAGDRVVIKDRGAKRIRVKRTLFGACRATNRQRVVCEDLSVFLFLRDKADRVAFVPGADGPESDKGNPFAFAEDYEDSEGAVTITTYVDAGPGDDRVIGSRYDDVILPGPGRDTVFGRGGPDTINVDADSDDDHLRGGGGGDALYTDVDQGEVVDLAARTLTSSGQTDSVAGFERLHTGGGDDVLRGTDRAEALYGGTGNDTLDGRGGSDLLFGDSPQTAAGRSSPNTIAGGDGDDFIDARSRNAAPTSSVECGAGDDVVTGEVDDRLERSCERIAFRFGTGETFYEDQPDFDHSMLAFPVSREADGDPVYAIPCDQGRGACSGRITLESTDAQPAEYGSQTFEVPAGQSANVAVTLNAAGQAAVAAGNSVAVRMQGQLKPGGEPPATPFNFGWQHVIGP